jgi:hypothetical protein
MDVEAGRDHAREDGKMTPALTSKVSEFEAAARSYAKRGWQVIPLHSIHDGQCTCGKADCSSPGKHPRTANGLKDATADTYQIRDWGRKWSNASVGIVTGAASGLVVVDVDPARDAWASLDTWQQQYGELPQTVACCTGGGGLHYYFQHPGEPIKNRTNLVTGIDIRADGGYVVGPPSNHVSGGEYRWDEGCSPDEVAIAPLPGWLLEKLREPPTAKHETNGTASHDDHAKVLQRARQYSGKAAPAPKGDRNRAAFNLAGNLAAMETNGERLSEKEILELVRGWNLGNNPPLEDSELQTAVKSGCTNGTPRANKPAEIQSRQRDAGNCANGAVEVLRPIAKFTLKDLRANFPTLNPPVINGLIRRGETANLISVPKVGKSWLSYHLEIALAMGLPFLGRFETTPGRVLKVDNELDPRVLAYRYPLVGDAMGVFLADYHERIDVWPLRGNLQSLYRLQEEFERLKPGDYQAIIIDAKYRIGNGESENDNAAETAFYNTVDQIASHTQAAIFLIHHSSKGSQSEKRVTDVGSGAGAQSRAADCHIALREHEEPGVVVLDAAVRSFPPIEPVALRWQFPLWTPCGVDTSLLKGRKPAREEQQEERDRSDINKIVDVLQKGPATVRAVRAKTGWGKSKVERLLDKLTADDQVTVIETTIRGNKCHEFSLSESTE